MGRYNSLYPSERRFATKGLESLEQSNVADTAADLQHARPQEVRRPPLRDMWRRLNANSLLQHNVLLFVANMATSGLNYLFYPIVGKFLGADGLGILAPLGALSIIFLIPTQIVANIANKFAADLVAQEHIDQVNYLLRKSTGYALIAGALTAAIFAILSPTLSIFLKLPSSQFVLIASFGLIISYAYPINSGVLQGRQQFGWFASINLLAVFLRVALTLTAIIVGVGIGGILWAGLLGSVIIYAVSFMPLRDVLRGPSLPIPSFKPLLNYSLGATVMIAGGLLLVNVDTLLVRHFLPHETGYYVALATTGRIVLFVGGSLVWAMFPKVAVLHQQGRPHAGVLLWTLAGVFALSASVVLVFGFFPGQIITLVLHVPAAVSKELFWYGLAMLLLALANVLMYYFLALGRMSFVAVLLCCCGLQIAFIMIWHGSITQVVAVMVAVMAALLGGLITVYAVQELRVDRSIPS